VKSESRTAQIAVLVCRDGMLPVGAVDTFVAAGATAIVIGTDSVRAAHALPAGKAYSIEATVDLSAFARQLATIDELRRSHMVILPASPDGRDLAGPLALELGRPVIAGATRIRTIGNEHHVVAVRASGLVDYHHRLTTPAVVTLIGTQPADPEAAAATVEPRVQPTSPTGRHRRSSVRTIAVLPPDPATIDLAEASCIVAGGQGLVAGATQEGVARFDTLRQVGTRIGASLGGTRVASDAGWIPFERQIGTTGVEVSPKVYVAFGISGATQHTSGLGSPDHVISVNTDPSCPMMAMSDVAIVADAHAVVLALHRKLQSSQNSDGSQS
jgi:electron transfer flavoprotein alpha subunit